MNPKEGIARVTEGLALLLRQNNEGCTRIIKTCYEMELWALCGNPIRGFKDFRDSVIAEGLAVMGDFDDDNSQILGALLGLMKKLSTACRVAACDVNADTRGIVFDCAAAIASHAMALDLVTYGAEGWKELARAEDC